MNTNTKVKSNKTNPASKGVVGANLGFRKAAVNCTQAELAEIRKGEDTVLRRARIMNGAHPDYQNGFTKNSGFYTGKLH